MDPTPNFGSLNASLAAPVSQWDRKSWIEIPALLLAAGVMAFLLVDVPIAELFWESDVPDGLRKFLRAAEHYGTFYGQVLIFFLIGSLLPLDRRRIVRLAVAAWSAGMAANILKLFIARCRPKYFDFIREPAGQGFLGILDFGAGGSRVQSFPSAHTAAAVALSVALTQMFPRGRYVFILMAVLVGLQRVESDSHFVSDVLAGAIVGWFVGLLFTTWAPLSRRFDRFEAGL